MQCQEAKALKPVPMAPFLARLLLAVVPVEAVVAREREL